MTIGERIKQLRTAKNMTQEELGEKVGVKKAAIYKYETGLVVNLKRDVVENLAKALDTSPSYLMYWKILTYLTHQKRNNVQYVL